MSLSFVIEWAAVHGIAAISWALLVLAAAAYFIVRPGERFKRLMRWLLLAGIVARVLFAAYMSWLQYATWHASELGRLFLPPHSSWTYYAAYVGIRHWIQVLIALALAGVWYGATRLMRARSERYLDVGEAELTTLLVFAAGHPAALVMLPLAGVALIALALFRMIVLKRSLTTLGLPFLAGAAVALLYAQEIRIFVTGG